MEEKVNKKAVFCIAVSNQLLSLRFRIVSTKNLTPITTNTMVPVKIKRKPTGTKKKFSCKIPVVSIYSTEFAFINKQANPKNNKNVPINVVARLNFAHLVLLPSLINFTVMLFISFPPKTNSSNEI